MERSSGSLYRRLPLPAGVTADQIQAQLRDGVLEVTMPSGEHEQPKAQEIPIG
jgi:HSP20 family molecular chaperone IbpA